MRHTQPGRWAHPETESVTYSIKETRYPCANMKAPDSQTIHPALYVAVAVSFSALVFFLFGKDLGDAAALVSVVPVALAATFFGSRAGLVATALAFPFNTFRLGYLSGVRNEDSAVTQTHTRPGFCDTESRT